MSKRIFRFYVHDKSDDSLSHEADLAENSCRNSPSDPAHEHLRSKSMRQVDFCRQTGFDQGLLAKILSSVVSTLNVETALKLAEGLNIPPSVVFEAIGKKDLDEMLRRFYCDAVSSGHVM